MKKFRFTLQALFTVYQQREQAALEAYANALTERREATRKVDEAERRCQEAWDFNRERMVAGFSAVQLWQAQQYCVLARKSQERLAEALRHTQRVVDRALETLLGARQSREAVEKYRARQHERYQREYQRDEQKTIDDLARQMDVMQLVSSEEQVGSR